MSRSEFRWNKKRKHYSYLHKDIGSKRKNILITTKPQITRKGKTNINNVPLYKHPNPNKDGKFYLIPRNFLDDESSFEQKVYTNWKFHKNDKRKVKRIKRNKFYGNKKTGS